MARHDEAEFLPYLGLKGEHDHDRLCIILPAAQTGVRHAEHLERVAERGRDLFGLV